MAESASELLARLRRQGYTIALTDDGKIRATPPTGTLPDHIRAQLTERKAVLVECLNEEAFEGAWDAWRAAIAGMVAEYEARKPLTRCWVEARDLIDIWWGVMPSKETYDKCDTAVVRAATTALNCQLADYWARFDAAIESAIPAAG